VGSDHHGNRYGRSEQARAAVLHAADDLLVEHGFAGLTIEKIAAKAGVAKQTIYRWWPSKVDILMDAYGEDVARDLTPADLGSLAADLCAHLAAVAAFLTDSDAGAVYRALVGQAQHDPALATRLRDSHIAAQHQRDRLPFDRALDRKELPDDLDIDLAVQRLIAVIHYRVLVTGEPVDPAFTDALVDDFLAKL
jgi:AcrR family transcriptional regulator